MRYIGADVHGLAIGLTRGGWGWVPVHLFGSPKIDQNLVLKLTFIRKLAQNPVGNQEIHRIEALMAKRLVYFKLVRFYPFLLSFQSLEMDGD